MKQFITALILFCSCSLVLGEVSLKIEKSKVELGETFSLRLTVEGSALNAMPDLMPLQKDFTIEGTESNINSSIINGQIHSVSEWILLLSAKRTGLLTIPSLQVGKEQTRPSTIEVSEQAPTAASSSLQSQQFSTQTNLQQDLMLTAEVSHSTPYLNQQVIYTVKLYNSSRLLDASYRPPQVDDALFVPMNNGHRYQVSQNGRIYTVEEQQFAIFPQKTGYLKIRPPSFNALTYDFSPKRISLQAQPIKLKVKPIPPEFKAKDWLPAKQVSLSESYDQSTKTLMEGKTLVRTVVLQARGVPAELLPTLNFPNSDQVSVYPEKSITNNQFTDQDLLGKSTVKVTYLFNKTGRVVIPPLKLRWFNTSTGKEEIASLSEFTIDVTTAGEAPKSTQLTSPVIQPDMRPEIKRPLERRTQVKSQAPQEQYLSMLPWWIVGAVTLGWLLTILAWRRQKITKPFPSRSKKKILNELQQACLNNEAQKARDAVLKWGRLYWPEAKLLNLFDLKNLVGESPLREQINHLVQALYSKSLREQWEGRSLWEAILEFKPTKKIKINEKETLPPLHRL